MADDTRTAYAKGRYDAAGIVNRSHSPCGVVRQEGITFTVVLLARLWG